MLQWMVDRNKVQVYKDSMDYNMILNIIDQQDYKQKKVESFRWSNKKSSWYMWNI